MLTVVQFSVYTLLVTSHFISIAKQHDRKIQNINIGKSKTKIDKKTEPFHIRPP